MKKARLNNTQYKIRPSLLPKAELQQGNQLKPKVDTEHFSSFFSKLTYKKFSLEETIIFTVQHSSRKKIPTPRSRPEYIRGIWNHT